MLRVNMNYKPLFEEDRKRPMTGSMFGGMLMDEKLDYIHLVLVTEDVLEYIFNL